MIFQSGSPAIFAARSHQAVSRPAFVQRDGPHSGPAGFPTFRFRRHRHEAAGLRHRHGDTHRQELGAKLEIVPVTSANRIPYLQTKKVDLVISSLGKNPERAAVIDFSDAYAPYFNGVFAPDDVAIKSIADLSGKVVGVTRGSIEDLELTKSAPADATTKRYEDNNGTISAFLSGQVVAVVTGNVVAAAILDKNPPRKPELKFLIKNSPCYVGMNKNEPELMAKVNEIIAASKKDGTLDDISMKWLHQPLDKSL
ncbi:transporter substrate-binding domain-containing protein [Rhizobium sp. BT03]|uniref:transporter substrate-binding domain-containing protein n=1 Tax=Rhizobium sp. BT03 TaxID=3045156 RepID=UPI0024B3CDE9|nr:transporter substrate-binding domain-containing protein [Rhizobium sp. BT03]WHO73537.1 transporter substrate-binding domain-containing protein [Rhizobium sp. BT03]